MGRMISFFLVVMLLNSIKAASQLNLKPRPDSAQRKISLQVLPQNFYNQSLGYFCKRELQLQKATKVPVFIRLGSKEYVDYLEKKPNATRKN